MLSTTTEVILVKVGVSFDFRHLVFNANCYVDNERLVEHCQTCAGQE